MSAPRVRPVAGNYAVNVVRFRVVRETTTRGRLTLGAPDQVVNFVRPLFAELDDAREHFGAAYLDTQNHLVAWHWVSTGTLSASLVHPREVFGPALRIMGVASVILAHNHPSGDATPSREDIRLTKQLRDAGAILDIRIHDHIVLGDGTDAYV